MFIMPAQCEAFGDAIPPVGTRVMYDIVIDPKTERPRAENVQPESQKTGTRVQQRSQHLQQRSAGAGGSFSIGTIKENRGNLGFILQDSGDNDMFLMPAQ